ncbi:MAG: FAD-dependent thymidylate synthase [Clostridiales bacterium]|nr:FAD-dependent thymidylate synthase [Clostridiales bacterium]
MNDSRAIIIQKNSDALSVVASSGRISTQQGTAMEIYAKSDRGQKDMNLVGKVLSSGHKSVIEHQTLSVAFNNVSVLAEQYIIEFRLAAYTVKSRRYVDFGDAGFVIPDDIPESMKDEYAAVMKDRFEDYKKLMELGVPKEDARFVLPYCLRSNFFMTCDAREMIHMICTMCYGRGSSFPEIKSLGEQLRSQFEEMYPGVIDGEKARYENSACEKLVVEFEAPYSEEGNALLINAPENARGILEDVMGFSGRFEETFGVYLTHANLKKLLTDVRPRELEMLNYVFWVRNISLSCLTHFVRHRIQSPIVPNVVRALCEGRYVLPETVKAIPEAQVIYEKAFEDQTERAKKAYEAGVSAEDMGYFALSGHEIDILMNMNARELLHFFKLRTCNRAQWEIRGVAWKMLELLRESEHEIFDAFGPSCALGKCPEGKMTCGKPVKGIFD